MVHSIRISTHTCQSYITHKVNEIPHEVNGIPHMINEIPREVNEIARKVFKIYVYITDVYTIGFDSLSQPYISRSHSPSGSCFSRKCSFTLTVSARLCVGFCSFTLKY